LRDLFRLIGWAVVDLFRSRAALKAEIWTLRQQINVLRRTAPKRPSLSVFDRLVFAGLYRLFPNICDALTIVKPDTLVGWHRAGFRLYWRWKSRRRGGRPTVPLEIRRLIREMSSANPLLGRTTYPRRASQTRHRYRSNQRSQVYGQAQRAAMPGLENISLRI
jgi:hypothetical protein